MRLQFENQVTSLPANFDTYHDQDRRDEVLRRGIAAAQNGDRELARELLFQATGLDPRSEEAWMWLASLSDYPEELLAFLNNALEVNPANEKASEWRTATRSLLAKTFVSRGAEAHDSGSLTTASQCFDQALAHDPMCAMAWFWKASLATDEGRRLEYLEQVLRIEPNNEDARAAVNNILRSRAAERLTEAKNAARAGDREAALDHLAGYLELVPESAEAWILKSHLALSVDEKLGALKEALRIEPDNSAANAGYQFLMSSFGHAAAADVHEAEAHEVEVEMQPESRNEDESEFPVDDPAGSYEFAPAEDDNHVAAEEAEEPAEHFAAVSPFVETAEEFEVQSDDFRRTAGEEAAAESEEFQFSEPESVHEEDGVYTIDEEDAAAEFEYSVEVMDSTPDVAEEYSLEAESEPEQTSDHSELGGTFEQSETAVDRFETITFKTPVTDEDEDHVDEADYRPEYSAGPADSDDEDEVFAAANHTCRFCDADVAVNAFHCGSCNAVLTLSELDAMIADHNVDEEALTKAVAQMEGEWNMRDFTPSELTWLGIGHLNLGHLEQGYKYVQEASRLDPNNVILASQANTLAIRAFEMARLSEARSSMPQGKTIMVVDDSPTVRKLIAGKLEKSGHRVISAEDGVDALAKLAEDMPDLILLDINMPNMDGYEVCRQIRANAETRHLPVVMISGKDGFFDKVRGKVAGSTGYVTKPFGPETLMKALQEYLLPETVEAI